MACSSPNSIAKSGSSPPYRIESVSLVRAKRTSANISALKGCPGVGIFRSLGLALSQPSERGISGTCASALTAINTSNGTDFMGKIGPPLHSPSPTLPCAANVPEMELPSWMYRTCLRWGQSARTKVLLVASSAQLQFRYPAAKRNRGQPHRPANDGGSENGQLMRTYQRLNPRGGFGEYG